MNEGRRLSRKSIVISRKFINKKILARSAQNELTTNDYLLTTKALGFTMAEILLSLTIIGVVAAITLPSLTGNINERTWNTQRKALYARMSQAIALMPALNGYGTYNETTDTAAETFVTKGLAKVLKINNICDSENLKDCGIASQFIAFDGTKKSVVKTLREWNNSFVPTHMGVSVDTKAAAFETANGESIIVYYNPKCRPNNAIYNRNVNGDWQRTQIFMCANFIYDLNGTKGPNTVGKDIGIMTAMYATDTNLVAPVPEQRDSSEGEVNYNRAITLCKNEFSDSRIPNIEEVLSLYFNRYIFNNMFLSGQCYWSGTNSSATTAWQLNIYYGARCDHPKNLSCWVRCVKR